MTYTRESAHELATSVLLHLAGQPEVMGGFLEASGLDAQALRCIAADTDIALHLLDYLLEDDRRVLDAAGSLGIPPDDFLQARTALAGPGSYGWEV